MVLRNDVSTVRITRLPVLKDKQVPRWKLERGPNGEVVWLSTHGNVIWNAPPEDLINVEEALGQVQPWNTDNTASDIIRARFKDQMQPELLFNLFGHGILVDTVDLDAVAVPEAATATMCDEKTEAKDKCYVLSHKAEQDMLQAEAEQHLVTIAEDEDISVFTRQGVEEWEREKWVQGLVKELDIMKRKGVLIEVDAGLYPDLKAVPSKLVLREKTSSRQ